MVRGEAGEAAEITVNGKPAAVNSPIEPNAKIEIKESTVGNDASFEVRQLPEYRSTISFEVNHKQVVCPKFIEANGELVSEYYSIKEGDELKLLSYYTLEKLLEFMDLPYTGHVYVNNRLAGKEEKVYENFTVEWLLEEKHPDMTLEEMLDAEATAEVAAAGSEAPAAQDTKNAEKNTESLELPITVNGMPYTLQGKKNYCFVDVLDVYPIDLSQPHGERVIMQKNGEKAEVTSPLAAGDAIDLYWK